MCSMACTENPDCEAYTFTDKVCSPGILVNHNLTNFRWSTHDGILVYVSTDRFFQRNCAIQGHSLPTYVKFEETLFEYPFTAFSDGQNILFQSPCI